MNQYIFAVAAILFVGAHAQYEAGFVKILEDQRYQNGAAFGNYRNQEDGIKYKEETDPTGVRRGSWEYPDENGVIRRVEFEAGAGIGFRIISSNLVDPTPIAHPRPAGSQAPIPRARPAPIPRAQPAPIPRARPAPIPRAQPAPIPRAQPAPIPRAQHIPIPRAQHIPIPRAQHHPAAALPVPPPAPVNIFDYPANLQFFRDNSGHRFSFSAL